MDATKRNVFILLAIILLLIAFTIWVLKPFLIALALAVVFSTALAEVQKKMVQDWHLPAGFAAFILSIFFGLSILASLGFIVSSLLGYLHGRLSLASDIQSLKALLNDSILVLNERLNINANPSELLAISERISNAIGGFFVNYGAAVIGSTTELVLQFFVLLWALFTLLKNQIFFFKIVSGPNFLRKRSSEMIFNVFSSISRDVVFSNFITGIVQASLVAAGAWFFSSVSPALVFIITFITSFIPVIGASPIAGILATVELVQQHYGNAMALFVIMVIVGFADNLTRAWLLSQKSAQSPFLNFLAVVGGIYAWGVSGIFLGPLLVILMKRCLPILLLELEYSPSISRPRTGASEGAHFHSDYHAKRDTA